MMRSRIRASFAAAAIALCPLALHGGVNQWTTRGPNVSVFHVAADPADPLTVYASGFQEQGVYKSSDGGQTWEKLVIETLLPSDQISCLAVDPTRPTTVYAATLGGQFLRSHDGGIRWESKPVGPAEPISIEVDATGAIYLGDTLSDVASPLLKSTDGGDTWNATTLASPRSVYALLADSMDQTLFAGTDFGYNTGDSYYGGSYIYPFGGAVVQSTDGGTTWAQSATDLGSSVTTLAQDPDSAVYAGTAGAVYRSLDRGANWNLLANLSSGISALAVDPTDAATLYAASNGRGVLRSTDGGATWRSFNAGMSTRSTTSLSIDRTGKILHAGTSDGVFDFQIEALPPPEPCTPGTDHLCLFGSRFRVDLTPIDPSTKAAFEARAVPGNDRFGYFSFPNLTGDAALPEVAVKMVDATSLPGGGYWVFYGSATSLLYTLTITDTTTGQAREYSGESTCGGADTLGFLPPGPWDYAEHPLGARAAVLQSSASELALLSARFRVTVTARNPETGKETAGASIALADRFGYFSLPALTGDPTLPEVFVKMIDAGGGAFLFFHAGVTTLSYTVTVVDTVTGTKRTYANNNSSGLETLCGGADLLIFPE